MVVPEPLNPMGGIGAVLGGLSRTACVLLAASLLGGCLEATQIEVELSTDVKCVDHPETTINVGALGQLDSSPPVAVTSACNEKTGRIGSIVVLPHDSKEGQVGIEVVAGIAKSAEECRRDNFVGGCIVARRALNFVKHRSLELPVELEAACVDVPCGATETCRKGACVSAQVDPNSCLSQTGCMIPDPNGASGGAAGAGGAGVGGAGVGGAGMGGAGAGGAGAGGAGASGSGTSGSTSGGTEGQGGDGQIGGGGQTSTSAGSAGQASAGQGGSGGQTSAGSAGQGGTAGQASAGSAGQAAGGTAGQASAGSAAQATGGTAGQAGGSAGSGGAPQLGPVLVASDSKSSTGNVSSISPSKALLPEHPGDILFAWVCIASQLGSATPQNSSFWSTYTTAPGMLLGVTQLHCQAFTAIATGGSESHAFSIFPSSAASIQRLEFAASKPPPASPPFDSGFPVGSATTSAMTVSQNHSALLYFFGVSGSTTLGSIKIGASGQSTGMVQITGGSGISLLTSGVAVAYDQPPGTAPKVTYAPASAGVWSSAGVVISPNP